MYSRNVTGFLTNRRVKMLLGVGIHLESEMPLISKVKTSFNILVSIQSLGVVPNVRWYRFVSLRKEILFSIYHIHILI